MVCTCGSCNEQVDIRQHDQGVCVMLKKLKKEMNTALIDIQKHFEDNIKHLGDTFNLHKHVINTWEAANRIINMDERIKELERVKNIPDPSYINLRNDNRQLKNSIESLATSLDLLTTRNKELQDRINNEPELTDMGLRNENRQLRKVIETTEKDIKEVEEANEGLKKMIEKLKEANEILQSTNKHLTEELKIYKNINNIQLSEVYYPGSCL